MPVQSADIFALVVAEGMSDGRIQVRASVRGLDDTAERYACNAYVGGLIDALALADALLYAWGTGGVIGLAAFYESQYPSVTPPEPVERERGPFYLKGWLSP